MEKDKMFDRLKKIKNKAVILLAVASITSVISLGAMANNGVFADGGDEEWPTVGTVCTTLPGMDYNCPQLEPLNLPEEMGPFVPA